MAVHLWRLQGFIFVTASEAAIGNAVRVPFARADITKNHKLGDLNNRYLLSCSSVCWKFKVTVLAKLFPSGGSEGESVQASFPTSGSLLTNFGVF